MIWSIIIVLFASAVAVVSWVLLLKERKSHKRTIDTYEHILVDEIRNGGGVFVTKDVIKLFKQLSLMVDSMMIHCVTSGVDPLDQEYQSLVGDIRHLQERLLIAMRIDTEPKT